MLQETQNSKTHENAYIVASSKHDYPDQFYLNKELNIVGSHAYHLEPIMENGIPHSNYLIRTIPGDIL